MCHLRCRLSGCVGIETSRKHRFVHNRSRMQCFVNGYEISLAIARSLQDNWFERWHRFRQSSQFQTTVWEDNSACQILANLEPGRQTPRSKHCAIKQALVQITFETKFHRGQEDRHKRTKSRHFNQGPWEQWSSFEKLGNCCVDGEWVKTT